MISGFDRLAAVSTAPALLFIDPVKIIDSESPFGI
jgi:hypothetical protein